MEFGSMKDDERQTSSMGAAPALNRTPCTNVSCPAKAGHPVMMAWRLLDHPLSRVMTAEDRSGGAHFGETNPRKQRTAVWRNEPDSSAQHFSAPAGMIAATSQEDFEWTSEPPTD
jgi:hypothetical protein